MAISFRNYTFKAICITIFVLISLWAIPFYAYMLRGVYNTIDESLSDQKSEIISMAMKNKAILNSRHFGVHKFRFIPISEGCFFKHTIFESRVLLSSIDNDYDSFRVLKCCFKDVDGNPYLLEVISSSVEQDKLFYNLIKGVVVLYTILILGIFIINKVVLRYAFQPFDLTLKQLNNYRFGESNKLVFKRSKIKEFNELTGYISEMIDRNQEVFMQQREFLENASHELQTPLAILQNKMDWMIEQENLSEEQLKQLSDIQRSVIRMIRLNRSLLMLSKIENHQFQNRSIISLNEVVKELVEEYQELFVYKYLNLTVIDKASLTLEVNKDLISILIANLLRNALRYTESGGNVTLVIADQKIEISNTADKGELDCSHIYKRFYKKSNDTKSTGLGLSIVKSIVNQYSNLELSYRFKNDRHYFTLNVLNS